jgi:hypothetical protein
MTFPLRFEEIIEKTLDEVRRLTEPLRRTLAAQFNSGRILPQFDPQSLISATDLYPILTGNPFVLNLDRSLRIDLKERYKESFDVSVLREIRELQSERTLLGRTLPMSPAVDQFLKRMQDVPIRNPSKREIGLSDLAKQKRWTAYYRVADIEKHIRENKQTKISDCVPFRVARGKLHVHELLFLMPKRALSETKDGGLCDVEQYFSVGRFDRQMITNCISNRCDDSIFSVYGKTEEDRKLGLLPHSLRHLMNNELFRLAVADTIITKRFNRNSTAQSYEYDHKSLLEELERITVPAEIEAQLSERSATLARLVKSGRARGPIVDQFVKIQSQQGELVATQYISTAGPGFHPTPYGDCVSDFMTDPCKTHVECFNGCRNLIATDIDANRRNLLQLKARLEVAVDTIEKRLTQLEDEKCRKLSNNGIENLVMPGSSTSASESIESQARRNIGLDNQLAHAKERLAGVNKLLATPSGQLVFPGGKDLSAVGTSRRETVLDTFK